MCHGISAAGVGWDLPCKCGTSVAAYAAYQLRCISNTNSQVASPRNSIGSSKQGFKSIEISFAKSMHDSVESSYI